MEAWQRIDKDLMLNSETGRMKQVTWFRSQLFTPYNWGCHYLGMADLTMGHQAPATLRSDLQLHCIDAEGDATAFVTHVNRGGDDDASSPTFTCSCAMGCHRHRVNAIGRGRSWGEPRPPQLLHPFAPVGHRHDRVKADTEVWPHPPRHCPFEKVLDWWTKVRGWLLLQPR